MDSLTTIDEILDFAIAGEIDANRFYLSLANKAKNPAMREAFEGFAREELGHKAKLEELKGEDELPVLVVVEDLKMADYIVAGESSEDMDYRAAIILAMQKEKAAFKLYTELAGRTEDATLREAFLFLAQEEAKHKLRFEIEYDDVVLADD